jgi:hypothetical protein
MPGWERRNLWQELEPLADFCGQLEVQTERNEGGESACFFTQILAATSLPGI